MQAETQKNDTTETAVAFMSGKYLQQFLSANLQPGEHYAGLILDGAQNYHVVLLPERMECCHWYEAMAWGELPNLREMSLLNANLAAVIGNKRLWSSEECPDHQFHAGVHYTNSGEQAYREKTGDPGAACAIRRIYLT